MKHYITLKTLKNTNNIKLLWVRGNKDITESWKAEGCTKTGAECPLFGRESAREVAYTLVHTSFPLDFNLTLIDVKENQRIYSVQEEAWGFF